MSKRISSTPKTYESTDVINPWLGNLQISLNDHHYILSNLQCRDYKILELQSSLNMIPFFKEKERLLEVSLEVCEFKLDAALEVIKFYADDSNLKSLTGLPFGRRAREFLEKFKPGKK